MKKLTGRDGITSRDVGGSNISFVPRFTVFLQCNSLPSLHKLDEGIQRRINVIDFPFNFVVNPERPNDRKRDTTLKARLSTPAYISEFMGIMLDVIRENKSLTEIPRPQEVENNIDAYIDDFDPIKKYIKRVPGNSIKCEDFRKKYEEASGEKIHPRKLAEYMKFNDIEIITKKGYRYFVNIEFYDICDSDSDSD